MTQLSDNRALSLEVSRRADSSPKNLAWVGAGKLREKIPLRLARQVIKVNANESIHGCQMLVIIAHLSLCLRKRQ